jgi:hypothetical protein
MAVGGKARRPDRSLNGQIAEKVIPVVIEQELESGRIKKKITLEDMVDRSFMSVLGGK